MTRSGVTQTRTFVYTATDLTSATNPENNTVTYTYDAAHHVTSRTDAKQQQTQYTYDGYGRLTEVRHYTHSAQYGYQEDLSQRVDYSYDTNPIVPGFSQNAMGRPTAVTFGSNSMVAANFTYMYSYNVAGRVTAQRMRVQMQGVSRPTDLDAAYAWDNQGRMTSQTYPGWFGGSDPGPTYAYQFDAMGRLGTMTEDLNQPGGPGPATVANATYGIAGNLLSLGYYGFNESRSYNGMFQLTGVGTGGLGGFHGNQWVTGMSMEYRYSATQNNGQIVQSKDWVSGEEVTYTYDALKRLAGAVTTGPEWGEAYTYDGFGNLMAKTPTKGTAPALYVSPNSATNQPVPADANGNPAGYVYDVENRLMYVGGGPSIIAYGYDPAGKRIAKWYPAADGPGAWELQFYGIGGRRIATYQCAYAGTTPDTFGCTPPAYNVYFGGKLLKAQGLVVATDRLGSVRYNSAGETFSYFPYGEERTSTADGREKFGTYYRDGPRQDYADQRYYSSNTGAFFSPDPSMDNVDYADPGSWNAYTYANGDPVNFNDPTGLVTCGDLDVFGGGSVSDYMNARGNTGLLTRFVWAEGGTLSQNGGSQLAMGYAQMLIAQSIENRLSVANGQVAVQGANGNIYWGNGGTFNGVTVLPASNLGYGGQGTTLAQELVRAAAGTGEVNSRGELVDKSGLNDTLDQELGDVSRALAGRVAVNTVGGGVIYVTPECDRAISAMQATNTILGGASLNANGFFPTSWKANGNSNPDPGNLYNLGSVGGTTFFGVGNFAYGQYAYPPVRRPRPRPR